MSVPGNSNLCFPVTIGRYVSLSWTDTNNGQTAYFVFRSSDGVNYTQIAVTGDGDTSYTDLSIGMGIIAGVFFYKVRGLGPSAFSNVATILIYNWENVTNAFTDFDARDRDNLTFSSGDLIDTWTDLIAPANNLQQTTVADQPTYFESGINTINGQNALRFGITSTVGLPAVTLADFDFLHQGATDWTIVIVFQSRNASNNSTLFSSSASSANTGIFLNFRITTDDFLFRIKNGGSNAVEVVTSSGDFVEEEHYVMVLRFRSSDGQTDMHSGS